MLATQLFTLGPGKPCKPIMPKSPVSPYKKQKTQYAEDGSFKKKFSYVM